jgi:hypothetical protein
MTIINYNNGRISDKTVATARSDKSNINALPAGQPRRNDCKLQWRRREA